MSCFAASKAGEVLEVCELLRGADGRTWPDVSAWYWHAIVAPASSSWWSYVIVRKELTDHGS